MGNITVSDERYALEVCHYVHAFVLADKAFLLRNTDRGVLARVA